MSVLTRSTNGEVSCQYDLSQVIARIDVIGEYITELTAYRNSLPRGLEYVYGYLRI